MCLYDVLLRKQVPSLHIIDALVTGWAEILGNGGGGGGGAGAEVDCDGLGLIIHRLLAYRCARPFHQAPAAAGSSTDSDNAAKDTAPRDSAGTLYYWRRIQKHCGIQAGDNPGGEIAGEEEVRVCKCVCVGVLVGRRFAAGRGAF